MFRLLRSIFVVVDSILELGFAPTCPGCDGLLRGRRVCARCCALLIPLKRPQCDRCGDPTALEIHECGRCLNGRLKELSHLRSVFWLNESSTRLLHEVKYHRQFRLLEPLLSQVPSPEFPVGAELAWVPLHRKRWFDRGFNQSEVMARWISRRWLVPLAKGGFAKRRETPAQSTLSRRARQRNLQGAFRWEGDAGNTLLLIDDVMTTGATLSACARAARLAGWKTVWGWTLFRAPQKI